MIPTNAYAVCGALIAAIATWAFLQYPGLLIWGAFIGWAVFLHSGGDKKVMPSVLLSLFYGVAMSWLFACIVTSGVVSIQVPLLAALIVAVMAPIMILSSGFKLLSNTPAVFYGFASTFAYMAQTPEMFNFEVLTSLELSNSILIVTFSLFTGVLLGYLQVISAGLLIAPANGALEKES